MRFIILALIVTALASCNKCDKSCDFGYCDNDDCICDYGYEGENCDQLQAQKFTGFWQGMFACNTEGESSMPTQFVISQHATDLLKVMIVIDTDDAILEAIIMGNDLVVLQQNVLNPPSLMASGIGTLNENGSLDFKLLLDDTTSNFVDECDITLSL